MGRETQERAPALDGSRRLQQSIALGQVSPALLEIRQKPARTFHAKQMDQVEADFTNLGLEFIPAGGRTSS